MDKGPQKRLNGVPEVTQLGMVHPALSPKPKLAATTRGGSPVTEPGTWRVLSDSSAIPAWMAVSAEGIAPVLFLFFYCEQWAQFPT